MKLLARSFLVAVLAMATAPIVEAAEVRVDGKGILVDGKPFPVRGAAGEGKLDELAGLGATTLRTYGGDPGSLLDAAQKAGLKVIVGLWLGQPRLGADYSDPAFVARQNDEITAIVTRYRDHPALLMWGIGNEIEVEVPDDAALWPEIGAAAALVKKLDPKHPTLAVLAETGSDKVRKLRAAAPDIDVLGINTYGGAIYTAEARAREQGWTGPVVITELGALGQWQAAKAPWGAPFELTSTQKAIELRRTLGALEKSGTGAIAFLWGGKQEVTPTWHSLHLPTGEWTEASEAMADTWGGRTPGGNHAPRIAYLRFADNESAPFASWGKEGGRVALSVNDPDGDTLDVRWNVAAESEHTGAAGHDEANPASFPDAVRVVTPTGTKATHAAEIAALPPGRYRIFVEIRDGRGAAAHANLPFEIR